MYILGDWGTSRLRLWCCENESVVATSRGAGIGALSVSPQAELRGAIAALAQDRPDAGITLCGMAGARGGLREAAYCPTPVSPQAWVEAAAAFDFDGIPTTIAAGVVARSARGVDIMRGEETQVFGALALDPSLAIGTHTFLLPGTHSKWVEVSGGCITALTTFPSGELFALLVASSLVAIGEEGSDADESAGFAQGSAEAASGSGLLASLFPVRTAQVLENRSRQWARGYLSGLLLGHELLEAGLADAPSQTLNLIGAPELAERYATLLAKYGHRARLFDAEAATLAGLEMLNGRT